MRQARACALHKDSWGPGGEPWLDEPIRTRRSARCATPWWGSDYISQVAVLPAFAHARKNSELAALVSDDPEKLRKLGRKYRVDALYGYEDYERGLEEAQIDAVYIALPNDHAPRVHRARGPRRASTSCARSPWP